MKNLLNFYIGGNWISPISPLTMPVLNPATEIEVASVAMGNEDDVNRAVAAAKHAWESFSKTSKAERLQLLSRLKIETEKLGAKVEITDTSLELINTGKINHNISIDTYNDHRMAMAFAPLGLKVPININNTEVVSKSYPDFWDDLRKINFDQKII